MHTLSRLVVFAYEVPEVDGCTWPEKCKSSNLVYGVATHCEILYEGHSTTSTIYDPSMLIKLSVSETANYIIWFA